MSVLSEAKPIESREISPFQRLYFKAATTCFQIKRTIEDWRSPLESLASGEKRNFTFLWAESRSPLFSDKIQERVFETAKQENLRIALKNMNSIVVPAGSEFSFWKQAGKPTVSRGFQVGREIRWGCTIPSLGGGLCQLSGALYECALQMGAEITEVHSHSHRLPGAEYHPQRDATIFWNYVDFRFQPLTDIFVESSVNEEELILRFWGRVEKPKQAMKSSRPFPGMGTEAIFSHDCLVCGMESCAYHGKTEEITSLKGLIFSPELGPLSLTQKLKTRILSLAGRFMNRLFHFLGYPVGKTANLRAKNLARLIKILYPFQRKKAVVSQDLAPFLHGWFQSRGIPYLLKLEHLPMKELQDRLDQMVQVHPEDSRLKDFRAPKALLEQEVSCILAAQDLWTDHPYLKELFPKAEFHGNDGVPGLPDSAEGPKDLFLFPGPCYAREGLSEVLEAAGRLNLKVVCPHPTAQGHSGVQYLEKSKLPWGRIVAYIHPCVFDRPNFLLNQAVANEITIVGTLGVPYRGPLLQECALGDVGDLEARLQKIQIHQKGGKDV